MISDAVDREGSRVLEDLLLQTTRRRTGIGVVSRLYDVSCALLPDQLSQLHVCLVNVHVELTQRSSSCE